MLFLSYQQYVETELYIIIYLLWKNPATLHTLHLCSVFCCITANKQVHTLRKTLHPSPHRRSCLPDSSLLILPMKTAAVWKNTAAVWKNTAAVWKNTNAIFSSQGLGQISCQPFIFIVLPSYPAGFPSSRRMQGSVQGLQQSVHLSMF